MSLPFFEKSWPSTLGLLDFSALLALSGCPLCYLLALSPFLLCSLFTRSALSFPSLPSPHLLCPLLTSPCLLCPLFAPTSCSRCLPSLIAPLSLPSRLTFHTRPRFLFYCNISIVLQSPPYLCLVCFILLEPLTPSTLHPHTYIKC
jgi:hypothetical protein